jgi:hypothetical protein
MFCMKIKFTFHILLAFLLLSSCSVLTDSQLTNINAFATTAKSYSTYPGEVFKRRAELHLNNELLQASQFTDAAIIGRTVNNARAHYKSAIELSDKFDLSIKLLQQYAALLAKLSSDNYVVDLTSNTKDLNENLSNLVATYNSKAEKKLPVAVGQKVSDAILLVGKRLTRSKQARALKSFIPTGNALIKTTTDNLIEVLDTDTFVGSDGMRYPSLKALIAKDSSDFATNYKNIVLANTQVNGNKVSYASLLTLNSTISAYESTEALRQKTVVAATKLAKAHDVLTKEIERKKNMGEIKIEIQDLIADVQEMRKIVTQTSARTADAN